MTTGLGPNLNWGKTRRVTLERLDSQMEVEWIHKVEKIQPFLKHFWQCFGHLVTLNWLLFQGNLVSVLGLNLSNLKLILHYVFSVHFASAKNVLHFSFCILQLCSFKQLKTLGPCLKLIDHSFLSDETLLHKSKDTAGRKWQLIGLLMTHHNWSILFTLHAMHK